MADIMTGLQRMLREVYPDSLLREELLRSSALLTQLYDADQRIMDQQRRMAEPRLVIGPTPPTFGDLTFQRGGQEWYATTQNPEPRTK